MITEQRRRDSLRKVGSSIRYDPGEPAAARVIISRPDVFEQISDHIPSDPTTGSRVNRYR